MNMAEHTSKQFDAELEAVRTRVLQMGGLVEEQIRRAIDSLHTGNMEEIERIKENDHRVNAMEVELDEACSHIIARRQPAASDLRLIIAVIKTITDLERIGDEAEKIARMAKLIHEADRMHMPRIEVRHVSGLALAMLRKALDAFARLDVKAAQEVVRQDDVVDNEFRSILRQLITFMMEDPRTISRCLEILFVAKALERIGDHSKNMAEYVVYMVEGRDVRHLRAEEIARAANEYRRGQGHGPAGRSAPLPGLFSGSFASSPSGSVARAGARSATSSPARTPTPRRRRRRRSTSRSARAGTCGRADRRAAAGSR